VVPRSRASTAPVRGGIVSAGALACSAGRVRVVEAMMVSVIGIVVVRACPGLDPGTATVWFSGRSWPSSSAAGAIDQDGWVAGAIDQDGWVAGAGAEDGSTRAQALGGGVGEPRQARSPPPPKGVGFTPTTCRGS